MCAGTIALVRGAAPLRGVSWAERVDPGTGSLGRRAAARSALPSWASPLLAGPGPSGVLPRRVRGAGTRAPLLSRPPRVRLSTPGARWRPTLCDLALDGPVSPAAPGSGRGPLLLSRLGSGGCARGRGRLIPRLARSISSYGFPLGRGREAWAWGGW